MRLLAVLSGILLISGVLGYVHLKWFADGSSTLVGYPLAIAGPPVAIGAAGTIAARAVDQSRDSIAPPIAGAVVATVASSAPLVVYLIAANRPQ